MSTGEGVPKRGRGRPKKVAADDAVIGEEAKVAGTRKASTKATKAAKGEGDVAKKAAKPTPASPSTSTILREVAAKGTLKRATATAATTVAQKSVPASASTQSPPTSQPLTSKSRPAAPSTNSPQPPPAPRPTTIPLPKAPISPSTSRPTPVSSVSPVSPMSPMSPATAKTPVDHWAPRPLPYRAPPAPTIAPKPKPQPNFGPLPTKYKPAARRVTAIMVGLPIIIVLSIELWRRWDPEQIRHKFDFDESAQKNRNQIEAPAPSSTPPTGKILRVQ